MASSNRFRDWAVAQAVHRGPSVGVFAFVLTLSVLSALEVVFHATTGDFLSFYAAARAAGENVDFYDSGALDRLAASHGWGDRVYPYLYPPFLAHALRPLAMFELATAHRVWLAMGVVAFAAAVSVTLLGVQRSWRAVAPARRPPAALLVSLGAVLVWALPLRNNLLLGQVNPIVLLFISLAVCAQLRGRPALAGLWLAPAIMIKMTPAVLLLFFVLRRERRALVSCAACLVALGGASLLVGAAPDWYSFLRHAPERGYGATIPGLFSAATLWNFSPAGWLTRLLPDHGTWIPRLSLLVFAGACAITARLSLRPGAPSRDSLALASLFPALLFASPLTYLHHLVYLLPALVIWLLRAWSERRHAWFAFTLLTAFIGGTDWAPLYGRLFGASASPLLTSINLYAVLAFAVVGWVLLRHDMDRTPVPANVAPSRFVRALALVPSQSHHFRSARAEAARIERA